MPLQVAAAMLTLIGPMTRGQPAGSLAQLEVVVSDKRGQPVLGLQRDDFDIKEDGRSVAPDAATMVDADEDPGRGEGRFVILVLDDVSELAAKDPRMTPSVQRVARAFVDKISSSNAVTVLRLSRNATAAPMTHDEALMALAAPKRVGEGLGPAPLFRHAIQTVATIARQVASAPHRWKPVVLIGAADYLERQNTDPMSRDWFGAAEAAARAHVITYVIDPTDLARTMLRPEPRVSGSFGLAAETGGYVFAGASAAGAAVEQVWSEAGHYYHLEYKPLLTGKAPHRIDVRVKRAGVSARSRQSRWEPS